MEPMTLAQRHRHALCDAALAAGPDAPTLCEGWAVRDLLVHLVVRDSRPDAALAMVLPPLAPHAESVRSDLAALPFADLVDRVRSGPPRWSPAAFAPIERVMNVAEFLIHTEDIVRASENGNEGPSGPETTHATDTMDAAWTLLRRGGRLFYRTSPVGVVAVAAGWGRAALKRPATGHGSVILEGTPVELLLHAFGRRSNCIVEVLGDVSDVATFTSAIEAA